MLFYEMIAEFKRKFSEKLLDVSHIVGGQIKFNSLHLPNGDETTNSFWGYIIEKNGIKYLFPSTDKSGKEINIRSEFPIMPTRTQKVANKDTVYQEIKAYKSAKIRPQQNHSFKEVVDTLSSFKYSNPNHYKLMIFNALTSYYLRYNHRISSVAGGGKDSAVDLLGNLVGGCQSIVSPTYAKLEERAVILKWLAINEVVDITKGDWRIIQQYLLDFGAHRPTVLKHSKAHGIVGEEIDASELSLSLMYNDIDHYPDPENYFDVVTKKQVRDRYPAFRCFGRFTEDFNQVNTMDIKKFVDEHFEEYKELLSSIEYYKQNLFNNVHNYNRDKIPQYSQRIDLNLGRLFTVIDVYSSTQEEFNKWVEVVKESLRDYQVMRTYLSMVQQISNKMGINKKDYETFKKINYVKEYIKSHDPEEKNPETKFNLDYLQKIEKADTYIQKKQLIDNYKFIEQQQKIDDKIFW